MQGIRRNEHQIAALHSGLRRLIGDRTFQSTRDLRGVVTVLARRVRGPEHEQAMRPDIEMKRGRGHVSSFVQVRSG